MSKRFKFILSRTAIIEEHYEIEADSEEEAINIAYDGGYGEPIYTEFLDWRDDEWTVADREENCKLYNMIKDHKCATS